MREGKTLAGRKNELENLSPKEYLSPLGEISKTLASIRRSPILLSREQKDYLKLSSEDKEEKIRDLTEKIKQNRDYFLTLTDQCTRLHIIIDERKGRRLSILIAIYAAYISVVGVYTQAYFSRRADQREERKEQLELLQLGQQQQSQQQQQESLTPPAQQPAKKNSESLAE
ncbi:MULTISPECIES: hypothetical protein [unclassified Synechococcus]|uniref:hypothetical protein n=1 Tax=unclassified Synechococcus TaxID=2626047 RepID=UPI0039B047B0